jgi:DNA-binding MarR family transcriptional regulator
MSRSKSATAAAPPVPVRGCTCFKLRRLTRRVTAVYDHALAEVGLRVTQYSLLGHLRAAPGMSISALAEALDLDRTTLTRNLKPLLEAGWVEVRPSTADTRARALHITRAGEEKLTAARPFWRKAQDEVNAVIGPPAVAGLHELLDRYVPLFRPAPSEGDRE